MSHGELQRIHDRELEQSRRSMLYGAGLAIVIAIVLVAVGLTALIVATILRPS